MSSALPMRTVMRGSPLSRSSAALKHDSAVGSKMSDVSTWYSTKASTWEHGRGHVGGQAGCRVQHFVTS